MFMTAPQLMCFVLQEYDKETQTYIPIKCYKRFDNLMGFFKVFDEIHPVIAYYKKGKKTIYLKDEQRFDWKVKCYLRTLVYVCGTRQFNIKSVPLF